MGLIIRTNMAALKNINQLNRNRKSLGESTAKIASGKRVSAQKDDSAGASIATRMNSDRVSLRQNVRNINDGISLVQTAESALAEMQSVLTKMRELSIKLSSDPVLDDRLGGAGTNNQYGAGELTLDELVSLEKDLVRIASTASFNKIDLLKSTNTSFALQVGLLDNDDNRIQINLASLSATLGDIGIDVITSQTAFSRSFNPYTLMRTTDAAIAELSKKRGILGSIHGRLEKALGEATTQFENLSASQSQILDLDYASESANFARFQIQQQAGVASLAQAKDMPQSIVNLLS